MSRKRARKNAPAPHQIDWERWNNERDAFNRDVFDVVKFAVVTAAPAMLGFGRRALQHLWAKGARYGAKHGEVE